MTFTCSGRGTCEPGCPLYGYCHCECGLATTVATRNERPRNRIAGRPLMWRQGHRCKVIKSEYRHYGKWTRRSVDYRFVLPELRAAIAVYGTMTEVSRLLGLSDGYISQVMRGRLTHIRLDLAMRIGELSRGTRAQAERVYQAKERKTERKKERSDPAKRCACGRRIVRTRDLIDWDECYECRGLRGGTHLCTSCPKSFSSEHGLYLHSMQVHGDKTQGRHSWAGNKADVG